MQGYCVDNHFDPIHPDRISYYDGFMKYHYGAFYNYRYNILSNEDKLEVQIILKDKNNNHSVIGTYSTLLDVGTNWRDEDFNHRVSVPDAIEVIKTSTTCNYGDIFTEQKPSRTNKN